MTTDPPKSASFAKPLLIAGGILFALCAGGAALLGVGGWMAYRAGVEQLAKEEEFLQRLELPAADAPPEAFAPESVGDYKLAAADDQAGFPALGVSGEGRHVKYERGDDVIEISIFRMDEAASNALFDEVIRRIDDSDRFASHWFVRLPRSLKFSIDPPPLHGQFWYKEGWLIFARSSTVEDLAEFVGNYLGEG